MSAALNQTERALAASGQPARLFRSSGTVDTRGVLSRRTVELLDGDRQPVTFLTIPVGASVGLLEGDAIRVGGYDWTAARVSSNLETASVQLREARRAA